MRGAFSNIGFCQSLLSIIEKHCGNAVAVDLSGNAITTLQPISRLAHILGGLESLSLSNNQLKGIGELGHLKNLKTIKHIAVAGNPGVQKLSPDEYRQRLLKYFPALESIDGAPVGNSLPVAIGPGFVPDHLQGVIGQFVAQLFAQLDTPGRPTIGYGYEATTSVLSVTTLKDGGGQRLPKSYTGHSRNLLKLNDLDR